MQIFDPKFLSLRWHGFDTLTPACLTGIIRLAFLALICSVESLP